MTTIEETQQRIQQQREQLARAREQIGKAKQETEQFNPRLQSSQRELRNRNLTQLARAKGIEAQRTQAQQEALRNIQAQQEQVSQAEQQVNIYGQSFEEYLRTPEGMKQYVKEFNLQPIRTENVPVVPTHAPVEVRYYSTPYGTLVDDSAVKELQQEYQQRLAESPSIIQGEIPQQATSVSEQQLGKQLPSIFQQAPDVKTFMNQQVEQAKVIAPEIQQYQGMGYSKKEATTLAEFSQEYQVTPSVELAEQILSQNVKYSIPERVNKYGVLPTVSYYKQKGFERIGQAGSQLYDLEVSGLGVRLKPKISANMWTGVNQLLLNEYQHMKTTSAMLPTAIAISTAFIPKDKRQNFINVFTPQKLPPKVTKEAMSTLASGGSYFIPYFGQASFIQDVGAGVERIGREYAGKGVKGSPVSTGEKLFVAGAIVAPFLSRAYKPIVQEWFGKVARPIGKASTTFTSLDIIKPVQAETGAYEQGGFILKSKSTTPKIEVSNRFRQLLGKKPIETIPSKTRIDYAYTPFGIATKEGSVMGEPLILSKRVGAKFGTMETLKGTQVRITPEEFTKLPKTQQYAFQKIAEMKTRGIPVSMKRVPSILGKDFDYSIGGLELTKRGRIYPAEMKFFQPRGRTISRAEIATIAKEVQLPERLGQLGFQKFRTLTLVKDTTMPLSRATGKLPKIKGTTLVLPMKETGTDMGFLDLPPLKSKLKPVNIPKSIETLSKAKSLIAKDLLNKIKASPPKVIPEKPLLLDTGLLPRMVGGAGLLQSDYFGKGTYEVQEGFGVSPKVINIQDLQQVKTSVNFDKQVLNMENISNLKNVNKATLKVNLEKNLLSKLISNEKLKIQPTNEILVKKLNLIKQLQNVKQSSLTKQTAQVTRQITKQLPKQLPKTSKIKIPLLESGGQKIRRLAAQLRQGFNVKIRTGGRIVTVGKNLPIGKALELGQRTTKKSLAQTFGLEKAGLTAEKDIQANINAQLFGKPKRARTNISELTFVERRGKTLTTGSEVFGLQSKRKKKSRRNRLWG